MSFNAEDVVWYCRDYNRVELIYSYGDFQNIPLVGARGGVINYNPVLSLRQLGYQLKEEPKAKLLEEFLIAEGVEDADIIKRIRRAWGKVHCIGKKELGKENCVTVESYIKWVKSRAKSIKLPYPWDPSMGFKAPKPFVAVILEENVLNKTIKSLENENAELRSNFGRLTREKEDLKLKLNQKRATTSQAVEEDQEEQLKRRKVGDALKGTIGNLFIKKK